MRIAAYLYLYPGDLQHIHHAGWFRYRIAVLTHSAKVLLERLAYQFFRFLKGESQRHAAWKVGYGCPPTVGRLLVDHRVFHCFSPACFRMDESVPGGTSIDG